MKTAFSLLAVVLLACALPRTASAQCDDGCAKLVKEGQPAGWGCVYMEGSGRVCSANRYQCVLTRCDFAYLTTPDGRLVEMRNGCPESRTMPARVASALRQVSDRVSAALTQQMRTAAVEARPRGPAPT